MHTFILAGGFATRLWPLTEKRAKPLLPIAGKPIIAYLVEKIPKDSPITISTNAAFEEQFREWLQSFTESAHPGGTKREINLLIEDTRHDDHKLGALGAVREWIQKMHIEDDILLLTGDNYLGFAMEEFLRHYHEGTPLLAAYDIGDLHKASHFGTVLIDPQHPTHIIGFEEKPKEPKTTLVSTGCCIIPKEQIETLVHYSLQKPDNVGGIFEEFLKRGIGVECFTFTEPWLDIGSFHSYLDAHKLLIGQKTMSASPLGSTVCQGMVYVGKHCTLERSRLTDCVVYDGCTIVNCVLRHCVIDEGCDLRNVDLTGKMLRERTRLGGDIH